MCAVIKWIDEEIITFDGLGNSTVDGYPLSREDVTYNLDWLLSIKMKENKFELTQKEYNTWVWKVFLLDMLVGNFDRHEGNWGFIRNKRGLYEPSPLYDMGSSMYQRYIGLNTDKWTDAYVKNEIEYKTRSAIIYKDKKRNYFELMKTFINNDRVRELLVELLNKIDNTSFKDIYKNIGDYNSDYKEYARFVERVINMRIKLLKELIK